MLGRLKDFFFTNNRVQRSPEIGAFVGYLKDKIDPNEFSEILSKRLYEFEKKDSKLSHKDIPGLYLLFEKSSNQLRAYDREKIIEFRRKIISGFPKLNDYPEIRILYQDKNNQKLTLCCLFLLNVIRFVVNNHPHPEAFSFFKKEGDIRKWLKEAEHIAYDICEVYLESCFVISKRMYADLVTILGEDKTSSIYHEQYASLEYNYKLLQSFYIITQLFPEKILTENQLNSLTKQQIQELVYKQLDELESTNEKLNAQITENKKAQDEIRKNELKLSSILENSMDVVIVLNNKLEVTFFNKKGEELFGWVKEETIGHDLFFLPVLDSIDDAFTKEFKRFCQLKEGRQNSSYEFETTLPDGEVHLFELRASKMIDQDEFTTSVFLRDVTESRNYERQLTEAKEQAEQASEAKASFLSTMSHEVRTPLNAIIGMTQLLKEGDPRPDQLENIEVLEFSADNLLVIVNDILDFNKLEVDKIVLSPIIFNLKETCFTAISSYKQLAREKNISTRLDWDKTLPDFIVGDSTRISQILMNLINNAVKFTEKGEVRLAVKKESDNDETTEINFSIIDTGMGIPDELKETIFEQFTQVNNKLTRKHGGTGLGLAICRRLVRLLGGKLQLTSQLGEGSSFSFQLSLSNVKQDEIDAYSDKVTSKKDLDGLKILVVEDHKINQIVIAKFLNKWNCEIEFANHGLEAVKKAEVNNYELILMDIQMPIMDGFEATKRIRALDSENAQIPIYALTASVLQEAENKVYASGMNAFITKPFKADEFYEKLAQVRYNTNKQ